jgi:hypothetical protein
MIFTAKLEILIDEIEKKGGSIRPYLRPALTREDISRRTANFPFFLPDEIIELYQWHDGISTNCSTPLFRDNQFLDLDSAIQEYHLMCEAYADLEDRVDLARCFPFAGFDGAVYVLPSSSQSLNPELIRPVISVFEGVDIYFLDFSIMLDTCIEWYVQNVHNPVTFSVDERKERAIWLQINPGIFD